MSAPSEAPMATDYQIGLDAANSMQALCAIPTDMRAPILKELLVEHGAERLIDLFAQFIGLANSVVENNRKHIEKVLVETADLSREEAARINLPSILGALAGISLVQGVDQGKVCATCAYRLGTPANQSPITTSGAKVCEQSFAMTFKCHEGVKEAADALKTCRGYGQRIKEASS